MTATFILSLVQGAASAMAGDNLVSESFGMIALVAMTPIVAVQVLGLVYKLRADGNNGDGIQCNLGKE
jgi:hypothetical protein